MSVLLKICGLTSLADARYCAGAMVDMLGFVFHASSPRGVEAATVREIAGWIHGPEIVGVFVDAPDETINETVRDASLTMVQLHGQESPEVCAAVEAPVIKAFRVGGEDTAATLRERIAPYRDIVRFILLDTYSAEAAGGTGHTFDWSIAREIAGEYPLILSGGIDASNIARAVTDVRPVAIDLSSGVESAPGDKDFDRVADVVRAFTTVRDTEPAFAHV
jgi:phosphoribosylanthranilate isomerase